MNQKSNIECAMCGNNSFKFLFNNLSKILGIFVLVFVFSFTYVNTTYGAAKTLNVTRYQQEKTNWCWAACAKMMGNYLGNGYSQSEICKNVKGNTNNNTASLDEVTSAIKYATGKTVTRSGIIALYTISRSIDNNKPLVIRMQWNSGGGHVVVVSGYNDAKVRLVDPASGCSTAWYTLSDLGSGTTIQSGTGSYTNTWTI